MKILDSDHCIAILRGKLDLGKQIAPTEDLAITSVSVGELVHGAYKSADPLKNLAKLDVLLASITHLAFDEYAARHFGRIKAELERAGLRLADLDLQIASIALYHGIPLVTHNQAHFKRIPGLVLEDWLI